MTARSARSGELAEMKELLRRAGFDPSHAGKLAREGMGPHELESRLAIRSGTGSLSHSHGISPAQLEREIDEALADDGTAPKPRILKISKGRSFADRRVFAVDVQYPGEKPTRVEFAGPSRDIVGPVVMIHRGQQNSIHDSSRFGVFGQDWIRRFFA